MRDTRTKFSFWSKISSTISAKIESKKYHLLNHRFKWLKLIPLKLFRPKKLWLNILLRNTAEMK
jgi:hypothetical protein